ncbi:NEW3 domain-containing protein [Actinospica sp.]|uniref:NEW3 domain-containing protein n=1 Tax=Actinospica sp. TaxID=1872142 RepID=UPI002B653528|nr:NEW3 domain-containing protein [Actinospica sp.]HWG27546.1 NEW3 domain-containing protein [Actinospica sp.]
MKRKFGALVMTLALLPVFGVAVSSAGTANAEANGVGAKPALGWSSWSFARKNPTAAVVDAQADAMVGSGLAKLGYQYVNLDDFWYQCPGSQGPAVDQYGRWVIDSTRFPGSGSENGIQAVADHVHADGLKFGIYVTPGISAQAVAQNTPIEGTPYHADDIALPNVSENNYNCGGMVGIDYSKPGAQAFIDSWAKQFASWGVDYLKIDGVGSQDIGDVQSWSQALQATDRPIHLELSNSLDIADASTWAKYSNGWRTGGDIECYCGPNNASYPLTNYGSVATRFDQVAAWAPYGGPGAFNDYDSLEIGNGANDGLTLDERKTQFSLWALASSPLILGTDLTNLDPTDLSLLKNTNVLAVDQDAIDAKRIENNGTTQVFAKKEANGDAVVGLFNTGDAPAAVSTTAAALGLPSSRQYRLTDLWSNATLQSGGGIGATVPPHGVTLYRVTPSRLPVFAPSATSFGISGLANGQVANQPFTATETFTNYGTAPVLNVNMGLTAPSGYSAKATSVTHFGAIPGGQTVHTTFTVDSPPTQLFSSAVFTTTDSYTQLLGGTTSATESHPLTVHSQLQAPYSSYSSTTGLFAQSGSELGIAGQGADIWGSTNEYSTIYLPKAASDGTVATVEVSSQQNTAPWAKAGIIMRNDVTGANTSPGYVLLAETPGNGYILDWDANGDGQLDSQDGGNQTSVWPSWLKLVRSGATYTGYYSTDDVHWNLVGTASVPSAAATQDVGVAMTSHSADVTGEVDFNDFTASSGG